MSEKSETVSIKPTPGYLLVKPYIQTNTPYKTTKEEPGAAQKSEVLAVGDTLIDDAGITREAPCKVGDIIIHTYISDGFDLNFDEYRMVHFSQVKARLEVNVHE